MNNAHKSNTKRDKTKGNKRFLEVFLPFFQKRTVGSRLGKRAETMGIIYIKGCCHNIASVLTTKLTRLPVIKGFIRATYPHTFLFFFSHLRPTVSSVRYLQLIQELPALIKMILADKITNASSFYRRLCF